MTACKCVTWLTYCHRFVLGDMEMALNMLLERCEFDARISLVKDNPYKNELVYSERQAEASLIFNICALAEIGNNKSNLIGVRAPAAITNS